MQHLADPQSAIDDTARVRRPGGRGVLLDSDYKTGSTPILIPDLGAAFSRANRQPVRSSAHSGADPRSWTELEPDMGSSAFVLSSEMLLSTQVLSRDADDAVESGGLTREVADAAVRAVQWSVA